MLCISPIEIKGLEFGCGRCMACRINRRRMWAGRILLEASCYLASSFCTLTYDDEHLPAGGSLSKEHWRSLTWDIGCRYFGCGEYGDKSMRPHFHLILFGLSEPQARELLSTRWKRGYVTITDELNVTRANYIAGYVVKKMGKEDDPRLPAGAIPEFAAMSRRPGVGVPALPRLVESLRTQGFPVGQPTPGLDVPAGYRAHGKMFPLGYFMRSKLRALVGLPKSDALRLENFREYSLMFAEAPELFDARETRRNAEYDYQRRNERLARLRRFEV